MAKNFDEITLKRQIAAVLKYSQRYPFDVKVDNLFKNWWAAKQDIISALGGQLIYECPIPVAFKLNQSHKDTLLETFIESIEDTYCNSSLADFIAMNREGFFENKVINTKDEKTIPVGMKLVKAFKNFVSDKDVLYELQNKASQIIQEEKLSGILCISVHPLDFLSSSENNYNWRSCHALDGEYRCGNLSYMQDPSTMVVYIKSTDGLSKLPDFPEEVPWNNKKWRMLLYISEHWDMLMAGRQYPFPVQGALDYILKHLLAETNLVAYFDVWNGWSDTYIDSVPIQINDNGDTVPYKTRIKMMPGGEILRPIEDIVIDCEDPLHFNDLLHSSCYSPFYTYKRYRNGEMPARHPKIYVGHEVKCVCCGKHKVNMSSTFLCDSCDFKYGVENNDLYATCDCCGRRFVADKGSWTKDDCLICPTCAKNEVTECECCGDLVFNNDAEYCSAINGYVCHDCAEEIRYDKYLLGVSKLDFKKN